jgi:hypothetical protein
LLQMAQRYPLADQCVLFDENTEKLRWFMLPSEAQDLLLGHSQNVKHSLPFDPVAYEGSKSSPVPPPTVHIVDSDNAISENMSVNFAVGGSVNLENNQFDFERARALSFNCTVSQNSSPVPSPFPSLIIQNQRNCSSQTELHRPDVS